MCRPRAAAKTSHTAPTTASTIPSGRVITALATSTPATNGRPATNAYATQSTSNANIGSSVPESPYTASPFAPAVSNAAATPTARRGSTPSGSPSAAMRLARKYAVNTHPKAAAPLNTTAATGTSAPNAPRGNAITTSQRKFAYVSLRSPVLNTGPLPSAMFCAYRKLTYASSVAVANNS